MHGRLVQPDGGLWLHGMPFHQHERRLGGVVLVQPRLHDHGLWNDPAVHCLHRQHLQRQRHVVCGVPAGRDGGPGREHVRLHGWLHDGGYR